ncbi:type VI secretion system baseplate subunit TssG [Empedobacter tilapiae]
MKTSEHVLHNISNLNYNKLQTDFKAEAVAANLLKFYNANASVFLKRVGINERPYLKDIKSISTSYYGFEEENIIIESYRESIYDYLPEGLFHQPSLGINHRNIEKVVNEIKKQKEIEDNARKFFQPFELEFFNTEVLALIKETEFDITDESNTIIDIISELWPLLKQVDPETAKIFFYILPFLHQVRGNTKWISHFLSAFNNIPVVIDFQANQIDQQDDTERSTILGTARLGITLIPNGKHMDGERNWVINTGPIPYNKIYRYVTGHPFRELLQNIYDYLIPVTVKVFENFATENTEDSFVLGKNKNTSRLGYSTFI